MRTALITGAAGQDGPILGAYLAGLGYKTYGMVNYADEQWIPSAAADAPEMQFVLGDLLDLSSLLTVLERTQPDEVYNLASLSFVPLSWHQPDLVLQTTGLGAIRVLEAVRLFEGLRKGSPSSNNGAIRVYQASSSEMYGSSLPPQGEETPFRPLSLYAVAKLAAHHAVSVYRASYGLWAVGGILFNHESWRRGHQFVSRKVTLGAAMIQAGLTDHLTLGSLDAIRDWGFAGDYMRAAHLMLTAAKPRDYVVGTGIGRTVGDLTAMVFALAGLPWEQYVRQDDAFRPPTELNLIADASRIKDDLSWEPRVTFEEMLAQMFDHDQRVVKTVVAQGRPDILRVEQDARLYGVPVRFPSPQ